MHTKLCKILLQVNQSSSNIASRAELGRYPIAINILANIIIYRLRLENLDQNSITKNAFEDDKALHLRDTLSWYTCSEEILKLCNINIQQFKYKNSKNLRKQILSKLKSNYNSYFIDKIFDDQKKKQI